METMQLIMLSSAVLRALRMTQGTKRIQDVGITTSQSMVEYCVACVTHSLRFGRFINSKHMASPYTVINVQ